METLQLSFETWMQIKVEDGTKERKKKHQRSKSESCEVASRLEEQRLCSCPQGRIQQDQQTFSSCWTLPGKQVKT